MSSKFYKYCAVPQCASTTIKTPGKLFIHVPRTEKDRQMWLQLACRDPALISTHSKMYFCEDHFDLPNDMDNYMEYHLMKSVSQVRMKPGCVPTKFECQSARKKRKSRPLKKQRIEETSKDLRERSITSKKIESEETSSGSKAAEAPASAVPAISAAEVPHGISCIECGRSVVGFRYTCVQCADFDLCAACESRGAHAEHYVLRIPAARPHMEIAKLLRKIRSELEIGDILPQCETVINNEEQLVNIKVEIKEEIEPVPMPLQDTTVKIETEPPEYPEINVLQTNRSNSNVVQTALPGGLKTSIAANKPVKTPKKRPAPEKTEPKKPKESLMVPNRELEASGVSGPGRSEGSPVVAQSSDRDFVTEVFMHHIKEEPPESES